MYTFEDIFHCAHFASFNLKIILLKLKREQIKPRKISTKDESGGYMAARNHMHFLTKVRKAFSRHCECLHHRSPCLPQLIFSLNTTCISTTSGHQWSKSSLMLELRGGAAVCREVTGTFCNSLHHIQIQSTLEN